MTVSINLNDFFDENNSLLLYNKLKEIKIDPFPDNFKIEIYHTSDIYMSDQLLGEKIKQLQEVIVKLDIPHFFVRVLSTNKNISQELELAKNTYIPYESMPILSEIIDGDFEIITNNPTDDTFCILPWTHYYINPQGLVGACCEFNERFPYGSLNDESLDNIINGKNFKDLRKNMLQGKKVSACETCWVREAKGMTSARQTANFNLSKSEIEQIIKDTDEDGTYANFKLKKLDFRASNVCNLMCRMCSGKFSSKIASEENKLYNDKTYLNKNLSKEKITEILHHIEKNIHNIENVYFAGGEPLVMDEHYKILDMLLAHNKNDVSICYNTNFSSLTHKKSSITNYWKKFTNVEVCASIDLYGKHSNYFRYGVDYSTLEHNYFVLTQECPHVEFSIKSTLHSMNVTSLIELQQHWIKNIKISPLKLSFLVLVFPDFLQLGVLPNNVKEQYKEKIKEHLTWLENYKDTNHLISKWNDVINLIDHDYRHLQHDFVKNNLDKDRSRNQNMLQYYPEFDELVKKYDKN